MPGFHSSFGLAAPELGWVPAPSYLLRRDRILRLLRAMQPGMTLEVGCGAGALMGDLVRLGYSCEAIETSPDARKLVAAFHTDDPDIRIHAEASGAWINRFDYVLAFEVLEHIENDHAALVQWASWIKPAGHVLVSVPAHRKRWSASDVWAGHFRRYEREDLRRLLENCGFKVLAIECYGFPLANIVEPLRAWLHKRAMEGDRNAGSSTQSQTYKSMRSGTERKFEARFYRLQSGFVGSTIVRINFALQSLFIRTELGTGYLALAQKG